MIAVSFDGKHYCEVLEDKETVNADRYIAFLSNMFASFKADARHPIDSADCVVQHDNARPHVARSVQDFLERRHAVKLRQAPYSPDTNLCDRLIFPAMEMKRLHCYFNNRTEALSFVTQFLRDFVSYGLVNAKQDLVQCLESIIENGGDYV